MEPAKLRTNSGVRVPLHKDGANNSEPDMSFFGVLVRLLAAASRFLKVDLVKTYRIPLDLHPRLPNFGFTIDHLPGNAIEMLVCRRTSQVRSHHQYSGEANVLKDMSGLELLALSYRNST
ncbi:hypothetical protein Tco_0960645 [Tanacetum coccineum]